MTGKSSWSSSASSSMNNSSTSSSTSETRASGLSILLMTTIGFSFCSKALRSTYFVCGIGPSKASTRSKTPSTMLRTRSTSPPKSACPGVSTMLIFTPSCMTEVFLDKIVIPRSRSISPESMTRSATFSFERKTWLCLSIASTKVVLPWSTWAIIAILRISLRSICVLSYL